MFYFSIFVSTCIYNIEYFIYILISLIFMGLFGDLLCYSSLVVCEEIVSSNKRALFSSIINMGYGLCGIIYSFIFMYVQNWRYDFYIAIGLSSVLYLLIKFFTHDSPRSYIDDKDINNFKKTLQGIAKFNGIEKEFLEKYESDEYQNSLKKLWNMNMKVIIIKKKKKVLN